MRSVSMLVFSGTGNTLFAAEEIAVRLRALGCEADIAALEGFRRQNARRAWPEADLVGIGYPVHAFNAPPLVERIISQMPVSATHRDCFLLRTAGSPWGNGGPTERVRALLHAKKLHVRYEALVPLPSTFAVRYPDVFIKLNLLHALRQCEAIARDLASGKRRLRHSSLPLQLLAALFRAEHTGARFYGRLLRADSSCTACGLCASDCPTGNISMHQGKPHFGWNCTFCMRCSHRCPVQAISHRLTGRKLMIRDRFDLRRILADDSIEPMDINASAPPYLKDFRDFYRREGLLG